jgi:uncharacterized protein YlxP (DUF503 family)
MVIGILQFELLIHDAESLKDKRRVVNSVKDRLHREHMVAVAEVAAQDALGVAVLGLACVAPDGKRAAEVLDHVSAKLRMLTGAELGDCRREILHGVSPDTIVDPPAEPDSIVQEMMERLRADGRALGEDAA